MNTFQLYLLTARYAGVRSTQGYNKARRELTQSISRAFPSPLRTSRSLPFRQAQGPSLIEGRLNFWFFVDWRERCSKEAGLKFIDVVTKQTSTRTEPKLRALFYALPPSSRWLTSVEHYVSNLPLIIRRIPSFIKTSPKLSK